MSVDDAISLKAGNVQGYVGVNNDANLAIVGCFYLCHKSSICFQSYPQTRSFKILWTIVVILGFLGAGLLIGKSYKEWQESPVATSITTRPINDLDFPIVTICPPKGSNTALYHDLDKAGNGSLSEKDKTALKESAFKIFMEQSHKEYVKRMLAVSNLGNMDQVYQRYHTLPKPYFNGFEIKMWNLDGTITTPWYGGEFVEEYYKKDQSYHMVLELPANITDQVDSGSLIIKLEGDMRENVEWQAGWHNLQRYR